MRKALTAAMAALTLGGAVCATATTADARSFHDGGHFRGGRGGRGGDAIAAGVVGLALGAAIASNHSHYYGGGYGYYGGPAYAYGYGPGYATCVTTRWVWDPYYGRRVPVREAYAC
ncbi:MAG TPA: hypothetical protein VHN39_06590 [Phenylobacterium sp.]|nr:hypothetical protein [Phenylobacterium sp.]